MIKFQGSVRRPYSSAETGGFGFVALCFYFFIFFYFSTLSIPSGKFGSPYLGRATEAVKTSTLTIPNSACGLFVCPNKGMAANAWDV